MGTLKPFLVDVTMLRGRRPESNIFSLTGFIVRVLYNTSEIIIIPDIYLNDKYYYYVCLTGWPPFTKSLFSLTGLTAM